jgi:Leucine-rich repeat (LRR) protein
MTFLLSVVGLWLWLLSSCIPDRVKDGNVITFTWETGQGEILLCAEEGKEVEIAWGDWKKDRFEGNGAVHTFNHTYSTPGNHRVTVRGDVTLFECNKSSLTSLNVRRNSVLTVLRCNQNRLTTLDISKNMALSILDCSDNQLTRLDVNSPNSTDSLHGRDKEPIWMKFLPHGKRPRDTGKKMTPPDAGSPDTGSPDAGKDVGKKMALSILDCSNNQLTQLDASNLKSLDSLNCHGNQLTGLNVSGLKSLKSLLCYGNQLTGLDVSGLHSLKVLFCSNNRLTRLDVNDLHSLETLHCPANQLTGLDVSRNPALKELNCDHNRLTTLHTGEIATLKKLDCSHNQLTRLDVSKNSALTELFCNNNVLTELNRNAKSVYTSINIQENRFPPKEMTLIEAVSRKWVDFSANGSSIQSSVISLTNLSDEKLKLSIPPGTYLSARSGSVQNMVITDHYSIELDPKENTTLHVNTACMNMHRDIPDSDNRFGVAQRPANNLLSKVITLLRKGNYSYPVMQAAVWIVTDNASYDDVGILQSNFSRVIDREDYNTARKIVNEARKK